MQRHDRAYSGVMQRCGAKTRRTGKPCGRPAGWGVAGRKTGPCKWHGGRAAVARITNGRKSKLLPKELYGSLNNPQAARLVERASRLDRKFIDLESEMHAARAYLQRLIEKDEELELRRDAMALMARIGDIAAKMSKIQVEEWITAEQMREICERFSGVVIEEFGREAFLRIVPGLRAAYADVSDSAKKTVALT